jgi:hypothetical protein
MKPPIESVRGHGTKHHPSRGASQLVPAQCFRMRAVSSATALRPH